MFDLFVQLQAKLKTAIHHISRLVKERQQLIELSNRLRSEVARSKTTHHRVDGSHKGNEKDDIGTKPVSPREMVQKLDRQLNAVEQLQYSLTTKVSQTCSIKQLIFTAYFILFLTCKIIAIY